MSQEKVSITACITHKQRRTTSRIDYVLCLPYTKLYSEHFAYTSHGNKWRPPQMRESNSFRACHDKGVSHHPLHLAKTQLQPEEWDSFVEDRREGYECAPIGGCWCGSAEERLIRSRLIKSRVPSVTIEGSTFGFLPLVLCWKCGQKSGKLASIDYSWPSGADCYRGCGLISWTNHWRKGILFLYIVWSLSICLHSLL